MAWTNDEDIAVNLYPERIETADDRPRPKKSWGHEEWIVNNDQYCGKRLYFDRKDGSTSLHFHVNKHETMYVEKGGFLITIIDTDDAAVHEYRLFKGDSLVIRPNTPHRIRSTVDDSIMTEFSTHHEDSDSYRIQK